MEQAKNCLKEAINHGMGKSEAAERRVGSVGKRNRALLKQAVISQQSSPRELRARNFIRHPGIPFFFLILPRVCPLASLFFSDACLMRKEGALLQISFLSPPCSSNFPETLL